MSSLLAPTCTFALAASDHHAPIDKQSLATEIYKPENVKIIRALAVFATSVLVFRSYGEALFAA
jgi:F0F1-type ATP synthase assembly protein I